MQNIAAIGSHEIDEYGPVIYFVRTFIYTECLYNMRTVITGTVTLTVTS